MDVWATASVSSILGVVILVVVGLSMAPIVESFTEDYQNGENADDPADDVTGPKKTLSSLVPLLYIISLLVGVIGLVTKQAKVW